MRNTLVKCICIYKCWQMTAIYGVYAVYHNMVYVCFQYHHHVFEYACGFVKAKVRFLITPERLLIITHPKLLTHMHGKYSSLLLLALFIFLRFVQLDWLLPCCSNDELWTFFVILKYLAEDLYVINNDIWKKHDIFVELLLACVLFAVYCR